MKWENLAYLNTLRVFRMEIRVSTPIVIALDRSMSGEGKAGYEYYEGEKSAGNYWADKDGPHYVPQDYHPVGTMPVLCGVCGREEFKVFSLHGQYSTWCVCACGNRFEIHSG